MTTSVINHNYQEPGLKKGDTAYFLCSGGRPDKVVIEGKCNEGEGYFAFSKVFERTHGEGHIHTCNGHLTSSPEKAKKASDRQIRKLIKQTKDNILAEKRSLRYYNQLLRHKLEDILL